MHSNLKLWEESATDKAIGMHRGYEQIGAWSTATRGGGGSQKTTVFVEKTTRQAEGPNVNFKWREASLTLPARAKTGERDGITACFAMS